jgi:aminopeptidase N
MAESIIMKNTTNEPQTIFLKDYQAPAYFIDDIDLHFDLQDEFTIVKSLMRVRRSRLTADKTHQLVLNGEELVLELIKIDGKDLAPTQYELSPQMLIIHQVPDIFQLEIVTKIFPEKNTALSGLYRSGDKYCTQCEAEGFRRITYFQDRPDVLTRYTTTIVADAARYPYLLSNGNLIATGKSENGRHWAKWEDPFKKPAYLFALVAGDFDLVQDRFVTQSQREIALEIYVEKGYADQVAHAMHAVKEAMRWDEIAYGREYDLDVYMIVAIGDFNMGAMENKGLNIFNTKYVLAKPETATDDDYIHILSVIGHEYFHNWSGNRVTCRDWFQLSLKEGLTIFRDQSFSEDTLSQAVMRIRDVVDLREAQFPEDAGPLAHPVRPDSYIEINNFYTSTIYNKGAEVLRMMQTILGKSQFRKGMDLYFARFDGQAVTIEDFVSSMEDVSGVDLHQFRLWYDQAGTPTLTVTDEYDAKKQSYSLTFEQSCPPTPGQPVKQPFHVPVRMGLLDANGESIPLHLGDEEVTTEKVLQVKNCSQRFEFNHVAHKPIPSLLRHFSAPVKLDFNYSDSELQFLFRHDSDAFNRWEAGQKYALRVLLKLVNDYQQGKDLILPAELVENIEYILEHDHQDQFLLAEMLLLPSEKYVGEQMAVVDVDAIHAAREFVLNELANELQGLLVKVYQDCQSLAANYVFNMNAVGQRQLQNRCLAFLARLPQYTHLALQQLQDALRVNMTLTLPALTALANLDIPQRQEVLAEFYATWRHDALVIDKWFAIQATSQLPGTLAQVKALMQHEAFDIKNPNKVYALIGAFGHRNAIHFHAHDGLGYVFLREVVAQLDRLNPQVAARMVKPLTTWGRYDKERQELMREQLKQLLDEKLSPDMYELVTKSLE